MQIYIHIPFCEQKCSYCRFASVGNTQKFLIEKYVRYLCKEIKVNEEQNTNSPSLLNSLPHGGKEAAISTIYFGGGTPGVLSQDHLEKIFSTLREKYTFSNNIEISLESTPDRVTIENIEGWGKLGITRLSMGVQTLNSKSLDAIGRGNKGDIETALENIGDRSLKRPVSNISISLDFIIGLPYVAKGEIKNDIEYILKKYDFVKHISVYMLEDYYNEDKVIETVYDKKTYPDDWGKLGILEEQYLAEYSEIKNFLQSQGFIQYEISNFSKTGYQCKHNKGYWDHNEVTAFGLGAYGFIGGKRYANSEKFGEYYAGKRILEEELSQEDLFLETVMFQLRTSGLEEELYKKLNQEKLKYFMEEKYLEKKSDKIILSDRGVLIMDYILKEIV